MSPRIAWLFPVFTGCYLITAWTASYVVDFHGMNLPIFNVLAVSAQERSLGFLWAELFQEGSPTEFLQWAFLAMACFFALVCSVLVRESREKLGWILMSIGTFWMFLEDRYNIRHITSEFVGEYLLGYDVPSVEFRRSLERSLIEIGIYSLMGMIMLGALWLLWVFSRQTGRAHWLLIVGFCSYAMAAIASATRNLGDWYANVGNWLFWKVASTGSVEPRLEGFEYLVDPVGFWFLDFVFEESIELMGACALASWALFCVLMVDQRRKSTGALRAG